MPLQFDTMAFPLLLLLAMGTAAYVIWDSRRRENSHTYDRPLHYARTPSISANTEIDERKKRRTRTDDNCSICYEKLSEDMKHCFCGHPFHTKCILTWARQNNTCPNCRATCM